MDVLIPVLIILFVFLVVMTVLGHVIWLILAWLFRQLTGKPKPAAPQTILARDPQTSRQRQTCPNCEVVSDDWKKFMADNELKPDFRSGADFDKLIADYQKLHEDIAKQFNWVQ